MKAEIEIQHASNATEIPDEDAFRLWVKTTLAFVNYDKPQAELTIRLVDEEEGKQLNQQWRQKPYPTNVLSFPFDAPPDIELFLLGDIVICVPVVIREAQEQKKSLSAHWAHLVIHAVLHLLGYDHIESQQAHIMESLEINILQQLNYPNPYLEQ